MNFTFYRQIMTANKTLRIPPPPLNSRQKNNTSRTLKHTNESVWRQQSPASLFCIICFCDLHRCAARLKVYIISGSRVLWVPFSLSLSLSPFLPTSLPLLIPVFFLGHVVANKLITSLSLFSRFLSKGNYNVFCVCVCVSFFSPGFKR